MHSFIKHLPEGRNIAFQATQDEKERVLGLINQLKVTHNLKASTASITYKRSGDESFEEDRIAHEIVRDVLADLERAVQQDHRRIF